MGPKDLQLVVSDASAWALELGLAKEVWVEAELLLAELREVRREGVHSGQLEGQLMLQSRMLH
jgi:hypothetical protein